jgi:hypothetical protein
VGLGGFKPAHIKVKSGRGGGIRTRDPLLPKQMRYQAALRPEQTYSNLQNRVLLSVNLIYQFRDRHLTRQ